MNGDAWFDGVVRCRNRMCPVCFTARRAKLAREVGYVVAQRASVTDRAPVLATLTIRHHATDPVAICKQVRECWRKFIQGRPWLDFQRDFGCEWIAAEEVTRGENGWHPHMHVLLLPRRESGDLRERALWWHTRWAAIVGTRMGAEHVPSREHGTDLRTCTAAEYLTKTGLDAGGDLSLELTDPGAVKGRSPLQLLAAGMTDAEQLDLYVRLMRSRHRCRDVTMSRAASAVRKQLPDGPAPELAFQLRGSEYERLASMGGDAELLRILAAVKSEGPDGARARAELLLGTALERPADWVPSWEVPRASSPQAAAQALRDVELVVTLGADPSPAE